VNYELPPSLQHYGPALERAIRRDLTAHERRSPHDFSWLRRHRRVWALAGTAGSAVAAGVTAVVLLLSSGATPAYAGWSPTPTAAEQAAVLTARKTCSANSILRNGGRSLPAPVLTEARGRYVALVAVEHGQATSCVTDGPGESSESALKTIRAPAAGRLSAPIMYGSSAPGFPGARPDHWTPWMKQELKWELELMRPLIKGHPRLRARYVETARQRVLRQGHVAVTFGRAGVGVSRVIFDVSGGHKVQATVEHGWYFAWWPWTEWATTAQVTNRSGTITVPLRP
jgi:hypothetical protein